MFLRPVNKWDLINFSTDLAACDELNRILKHL